MTPKRKILPIARKISFAGDDDEDIIYWMEKSVKDRLEDMYLWNRKV